MLITLCVYLPRLAMTPQPSDSGELSLVTAIGTHIHPSGYPLYSIVAETIYKIFGGYQLKNLVLLSSLLISISCGILSLFIFRKTNSILAAILISISWGILEPTVLIATDAEVFGLNQILIAIMLLALTTKKDYIFVPLCFGLAGSNHHTVVFYAPLVFYIFTKYLNERNKLYLSFCFLALGFSPYLLMIYRLVYPPEIQFLGYSNLDELIGFWLRRSYGTFRLSNTDSHVNGFYYYLSQSLNFLLLLPFIIELIFVLLNKERLKLSFLCVFIGFIWFTTKIYVPGEFENSYELTLRFVALCLLPFISLMLPANPRRSAIYAVIFFAAALHNFHYSEFDASKNSIGYFEKEQVLKELPENAIFLDASERLDTDLLYHQIINARRKDLTFISMGILSGKEYQKFLASHNSILTGITKTDFLFNLVREDKIQLFVADFIKLPEDLVATPNGITYQVIKRQETYPINLYYQRLINFCSEWNPQMQSSNKKGIFKIIYFNFVNPLRNLAEVLPESVEKSHLNMIILQATAGDVISAISTCKKVRTLSN